MSVAFLIKVKHCAACCNPSPHRNSSEVCSCLDCEEWPERAQRPRPERSPLWLHSFLWQPPGDGRVPLLEIGVLGLAPGQEEIPHQVGQALHTACARWELDWNLGVSVDHWAILSKGRNLMTLISLFYGGFSHLIKKNIPSGWEHVLFSRYFYYYCQKEGDPPEILLLRFFIPFSALYVVDLKKFRKIAAGDRLRGQYQALSQDPNSLSNLDQVYMALSIFGFVFFIFLNMYGISCISALMLHNCKAVCHLLLF